jgi:hypothetical protein
MFSDPDAYKEDWVQSFVYKKAMKAEAIKRGEVIDSDWECTDDEDKVEMTVKSTHLDKDEDGNNLSEGYDSAIDTNIGFMKSMHSKGGIKMLSENEISYLKTFLKKQNEKWDNKAILADLYRHCKFTIRKLTRQMANIDNHQVFRKNRKPDKAGTVLMVYRAERLFNALADSQKIFKLIS